MREAPLVSVHVVTFNHEGVIETCLQSVLEQEGFLIGETLSVNVTDNASSDNTVSVIREAFAEGVSLRHHATNTGFAHGQNAGLSYALLQEQADFVLVLNPDVRLEPDCLFHLASALASDPRAGSACPRLYRANEQLQQTSPPTFDSTGVYITPQIRHFDRGSNELDLGQYRTSEYVFGGSGACLLLKKNFILDVALRTTDTSIEFFDEAFFAYREDADLAWRAAWLGWKCRYVPTAVGYHLRVVTPERRAKLPAKLNEYSVRNRFLLQFNNFSLIANLHCILPAAFRNLVVIGGVLTVERSSFPGLVDAVRKMKAAFGKRKLIARRRRAHPFQVGRWFQREPSAELVLREAPIASQFSSISIVIVNFNSGERLGRCLEHLEQAVKDVGQELQLQIIVVDNSSSDESVTTIHRRYMNHAQVLFELLPENVGFAEGVNRGAKLATGELLLVLNPDIEITGGCLIGLAQALGRYENLGCLSPLLVDRLGAIQLSFLARNFPTVGATIADLFFLDHLFPKNPWTSDYLRHYDPFVRTYLERVTPLPSLPYEKGDAPLLIPQPPASCLCIRRDAFTEVGGFDNAFWPAWHEDVDFCKRLARSGWGAGILATVQATHEGGYSAKKLTRASFANAWYPNLLRYFQRHGTSIEYLVVRLLLPAALLLRAMVAALASLASRTERREQRDLAHALLMLTLNPNRRPKTLQFRTHTPTEPSAEEAFEEKLFRFLRRMRSAWRRFTSSMNPPRGRLSSLTSLEQIIPPQGELRERIPTTEEHRDFREVFSHRLVGDGLELGPLHRPLPCHEKMHVRYVDRLSLADLRAHYPELNELALVEPDIIDDAEVLSTIPRGSYDFLIAAHLIEHLRNPIDGLRNWARVVKPRGLIYLIVPDKRFTFDAPRPRTCLEHLILDFERPSTARDFEHFLDYGKFVAKHSGNTAIAEAHSLESRDYSIHFHVFMPEDVVELIHWCDEHVTPLRIIEGPVKAPGSDEFHLLLQTS